MSEPVIEVKGLVKRYGDLVAVGGIDFELLPGRCLGVLGPNGAGKTTTTEILVGLTQRDEGSVRLLGRTWEDDSEELRSRIGVQLQETRFADKMKVHETLRLFGSFYDDARPPAEMMDLIGLGKKAEARVVELSGGQRQRLALGCALANHPELLFLDEPSTGARSPSAASGLGGG